MSNIFEQIADLSSEKRKLFEMLLREEEVDLSRSLIIPQKRESNTFPLSFAQQRLWFLDQLEPGSPLYNIPSAVRLTGRLNEAALEQSLNEIVRRHEILRTTFARNNGQPVQVIAPQLALTLPIVDLRDQPESKREAEVLRLATEEAQRPFDLTTGPLLRATLLWLDEEEYVALLTMHHIVSDGWSMGVLIGEIAALYEAFSSGKPSPLPDLRVQYADFAHWQRWWLQEEVLEAQLDYWKQHLDGDLGALDLPTDRPRPAFQSTRGASHSFVLPRSLYEPLKALGQQERVTLFMTLLAAFQTLLHRYTGRDSVSVGSPIANRNRAEIEGLIGFFVNILVMRTDLSGDPTFRKLLVRVREVTLGAYAHQDLPFEMLVEELQPERDMSRTPLFQVMFILQNAPLEPLQLPDLTLSPLEAHSGTATFDLTLSMAETHSGLSGAIEYNTDLFNAATIRRMVGHFQTLLEGIVADPDQPISQLPLLREAERRQLLVDWNDTRAEYPQNLCMHQLFEVQAARTPGAVAVAMPAASGEAREQLAYGELNRRANQLARYLQKLGVGPGILVGISVERSLEMAVGLLGILKAGGAYLPLDPDYQPERLAFMVEDSQVSVLLTQFHLADRLHATRNTQHVYLDTDWTSIAQELDGKLESGVTPDDLAYVIYTSGSTGKPKGVMVPHRAVVNHNVAVADRFGLGAGDRVLQFATINFDAAVEEIFPTWWRGGTVVLRSGVLSGGEELERLVEEEGLTVLDLPTAYWHEWVSSLATRGAQLPASVRLVIVGGDKASAERYGRWREIVGDEVMWLNTYGPTEATIIATTYEVEGGIEGEVPIGKPIANVRLYVLDRHLQPVPVGVPGELCIGGVAVARGYLNRPELTAERFIPDPFAPPYSPPASGGGWGGTGARLYKTGDLVRYRADGNIEFLGRVDHQVKVRGFRVELGEIEVALSQHPAVREAVVLAREDGEEGKRLVGYVAPEGEQSPGVTALRGFLKGRLPEYMIPSAFVILESLPLTPSGKVDRRALPAPDGARPELEAVYVAPRTPMEELLANIWAQVLGIERVGVYDNFFELGGHSLLATQLISRLHEAFRVELPLRDLFESPTVAALAECVEEAQQTAQGLQAPAIEAVPRDGELPLSFAQQRMWFLGQLEPGSPLYNVPDAVRINGPLDVAALERSLNEIVRRHEVLRTTFATVDGRAVQVIVPELSLVLPVVDLSGLPEAEREAEGLRLAQEEAQHPFDLAKGPLLRATLLRLGEKDHMALLTMHHIVSDAWSSGVLIREIAALYQAFSAGEPSPLPELPVQYADFAHWQRNWLQDEVLEAQLSYWKQQLSGSAPLLELPTDRPRPAVQTFRGGHQAFVFPRELSAPLRALSQQEGATMFMTLLAAFQTLLYRYTGQEDVSVGTPIANRNRAETEGLIGFFVNTLVLRTDLSGDPSFRELLNRVREVALGAYTHQDLPFEKLVDTLQPERDLSHTPLFQVMFIIQNVPRQGVELADLTLSRVEADTGVSTFDLTLVMEDAPDGLGAGFEYNADLFNSETIERMAAHFQILLEGIIADSDRPISTLPLLTGVERQRLLVEWNNTEAEYPRELCLHHLFETQAKRTPGAVAVTFKDKHLTYDELNRRANQLAHHLRKLGVGPETLVGLCVDRSLEMVVGLLGVLKAGGAYLPLDPAYPQERLAFIMEDSRVSVLLTQSHLADRLHATRNTQHVYLDTDWKLIAQESGENLAIGVMPENAAYVIYTSGSTGRPKGVPVPHRSVVNHNVAMAEQFRLQPGDRVLQFATINFDAAVEEIFPTWWSGATVVLRADDMLTTGEDLLRLVEKEKLTVLDLPTAYWHEWVYEMSLLGEPLPESLRLVIVGGEKASAERLAAWQKIAGANVVWMNTYGPTEGTIVATSYEPPAGEVWDVETGIPIGRPIANARVYLLDRNLQPVPVGVPGELCIGGTGVAQGYLNRPTLTAETFIPDPFSSEPGARLYKTGDLARYLPDGNVEFLGRVDHQVKVRGFRVEPGEIEAVLAQHPALRESVVAAREDQAGNTRLVAYIVPDRDPAPTVSDLRDFLAEKLPEYMVPSAFVTLDGLPLMPSGKVNRRALPAPDQARPELDAAYVAPHTRKEEILAAVWSQVLGVEQVGVHDNFFELGGDSILSIQVIARANQAGLRLTPRQLFEAPTIARLAAVAGNGRIVQAEQGLVQGPLPLTPIQRWFFEQGIPNPHLWRQTILLKVHQPLDPDLLKTTVRHLLAHHDVFRLCLQPTPSGWALINVGIGEDIPFIHVDLSELPEPEQGPAIETGAAWLRAILNLTEGCLLRVASFDLGPRRAGRLLITAHHMAIDGVSWHVLLEDFQTLYIQLSRGEMVQLPPKTTSFRYWAQRLAEYAQSDAVRQELDHWLSLARHQPLPLPVDFNNGANTESSARSVTVSLSTEETQALLQQVPAAYRTEINDVLLTALAQAFARWTGSQAILVDLEGHGREDLFDDVDLSRTVGWFTSLFPVRLDLNDADGPGEGLMAVKEQLRQVPDRGLGYGLLRYLSQDEEVVRQMRELPQPQVGFNYLGQFGQTADESMFFGPATESTGPDRSPSGVRSHLLDINGGITGGRLRLEWTYSENLHHRATVERLAQDFAESLRALIAHCQSPDTGGLTPSDFKLAGLDQKKLDKVLAKLR
ncbi:MAG: amino acid adenylation domain-containing protein [Chloroflexota bacterium]|nr:amino acid adenylation domain-containing protein [Chloroflexota bacterium]